MAQISRPFQIAALALVLFVAVWFVALHGHSSTSGSGSSAPSTPPHSAAAQAQKAAAPTPVYHGAAPGVSGLTRAIDKAHGAVATSQQNAKQRRKVRSGIQLHVLDDASPDASRTVRAGRLRGQIKGAGCPGHDRQARYELAEQPYELRVPRPPARSRSRAQARKGRRPPLLEPEGRRRRRRARRSEVACRGPRIRQGRGRRSRQGLQGRHRQGRRRAWKRPSAPLPHTGRSPEVCRSTARRRCSS